MELPIHTQTGNDSGRMCTLPAILQAPEDAQQHVLYLEVKRHLAARRQGTHKTKERAEVVGSTRKLKKQKGTGTARAGSVKSPIFRGGGTVFGPRPRSYDLRLSKKTRRLARRLAFAEKLSEEALTLVEQVKIPEVKTKHYVSFLQNFSLSHRLTLLVTARTASREMLLSARNLPQASIVSADQLSAYALLRHQHILIEEEAIDALARLWEGGKEQAESIKDV